MITLHHLENSRSFRILWLLEELGLEYELLKHRRDPKTGQAMADLKGAHTLGKAPMLVDGDKEIMESGAIIEYLLDTYDDGSLRPALGSPERIQYNIWLHAAEGTVMSFLMLALFLNRMDSQSPFFIKPFINPVTKSVRDAYLNPNLGRTLAAIEKQLGQFTWFAGDSFSGADVQMGFVMYALSVRGGLTDGFPNCLRWLQQMESRPAYQRAMQINGPMRLLGS